MELRELLIALRTQKFTKDLKRETFAFYNSMVGSSKYFPKPKDVKTSCGSCIQGVKGSIWKWYHYDESAPTFQELEFTGKLGIHNIPIYAVKKK